MNILPPTNPIPPTPHRRRLYHDVLCEPDRTGRFFSWPHPTPAAFAACARHLESHRYNRPAVSDILVQQNKALNAPPEAIAAAEELALPNSICAFSGQQAGLFGGPLYTIYKALTLLGWADKLRKDLNRPVVPIFWIASDDHDFEEVRWSGFPDLENQVQRMMIPDDGIPNRTPIANITLPDGMDQMIAALRESQLQTEFSDEVFAALGDDYSSGRSMPEAFGRWMSRLLGPLGLVMFNPSDPTPKSLMQPLFAQELDRFEETAAALTEINQRLDEAGYDQQVSHPARNIHLFHVANGRHAIRTGDNGTLLTDPEAKPLPRADWLKRLEDNPGAFSPGVLFRPIAQSYLFPVVAVVCGPSEIAYWAQTRALFDRFSTPMPVVLPRSCATIIEKKNRKAVEALGHDVSEFFGDIEALINSHFERSFPTDLEDRFNEERTSVEARLDALKSVVIDFEPTLEKTFEIATGRIGATWEHLQKKVFQAHKRKHDEVRTRFYKLATHLYPEGHPQERVFGVSYYLNKYGFGFIERAQKQLQTRTPDHQLIEP